MRPILGLLVAVASCVPGVAVAQTAARPSIAGCGTVAIVRADRAQPGRLEDQAECFERAAEIATGAAAERRALLVPAPAPPPPAPTPILVPGAAWTRCAVEGAPCIFAGRAEVRYGANGTFIAKVVDGETPCSNAAFGRDPLVNVVKACDVRLIQMQPVPDVPPAEVSALDPTTLLTAWQPRFAAIGFRLEIGPREPLPTISAPDQHRWPVALWRGEDDLRAYYAVFASAQGSAEAIATATGVVEGYFLQASHIAAGSLP